MIGTLLLLAAMTAMAERIDQSVNDITERTLSVMKLLDDLRYAGVAVVASTSDMLLLHQFMVTAANETTSDATSIASLQNQLDEETTQLNAAVDLLKIRFTAYNRYVATHIPHATGTNDTIGKAGRAVMVLSSQLTRLAAAHPPISNMIALKGRFEDAESTYIKDLNIVLSSERGEMRRRLKALHKSLALSERLIWSGYVVLFILILVLAGTVSRNIVKRISTLRDAARQIGTIDLTARVDVTSKDELGELAHVFNAMAERLENMVCKRDLAEKKLKSVNSSLEELVTARTLALSTAKEQAEQASLAKSKFLSSMSHELRTPLNAITGFSQLIKMDIKAEHRMQHIDYVLENSKSLLSLIDQVLVLSSLENTTLNLNPKQLLLNDVIEGCIDEIGALVRAHDATIDNHLKKTDLPSVNADAVYLHRAILNILTNAVKYNRDHGRVIITGHQRDNEMVRLEIADTGVGFVEKYRGQILEPFERLTQHSLSIDGAGVGLTIASSFVDAMHGTLGYKSVVGEGSTFWIDLPIAQHDLHT